MGNTQIIHMEETEISLRAIRLTTALVVIVYSDGVTFFSFFFTARKKRSVFFIPGLRRRKPTRNAMTLTVVTSSLL